MHPLLRVRRDVTGALRGILGVCGDVATGPGRARRRRDHRILDPRRARPAPGQGDRRSARGRAAPRARRRAGRGRGPAADGRGGPRAGRRPRRGARQRRGRARRSAPLAGRRQLHLPRLPRVRPGADRRRHRPARRARHRARHPPPRPAGPGVGAQDVVPGRAPGAGPGRTAGAGQGELPVHRLPGQLPGLRLGQEARTRRQRSPASSGSSACTRTRRTPRPSPTCPCSAASWPRSWPTAGLSRDSHDGKDLVEILEDYPREELFEISAEELTPIALGVLRLSERKQTRLFLRRDRYGRYMSCLVYLPQGPVHHQGQAARAGHLARGAARGLGGLQRHGRRLGPGPPARRGQGASRAGPCRRWTRPPWSGSWPRRSGRGTRTSPPRRSACSARSGPARWSPGWARASPRPTRRTSPPRTRSTTCPPCSSCASRGRSSRSGWWSTRSGGRWWCTGRAPRSRCPTCCPSCSTWGSRSSTSIRTSSSGNSSVGSFWIYEFGLRPPAAAASGSLRQIFEDALTALWHGQTEDDGFNALVLTAGLTWREVTLLRAYAKYLRQGGMRFSEDYVQRVLRGPTRRSPGC